jgi:hypothetical protein
MRVVTHKSLQQAARKRAAAELLIECYIRKNYPVCIEILGRFLKASKQPTRVHAKAFYAIGSSKA